MPTSKIPACFCTTISCLGFIPVAVFLFPVLLMADQFQVGPEEIVQTPQQRAQYSLFAYADTNIGVVNEGGGIYHFFSGGFTHNPDQTFGPGSDYRFTGSLSQIVPDNLDSSGHIVPSMKPGFQQPDPTGSFFDQNYAGSGAIVKIPTTNGGVALLQMYHAEFDCPNRPVSYNSLGMSISFDDGKTFQKLGPALEGNHTVQEICQVAPRNFGLGGGGSLIEADAQGCPILQGMNPQNVYYYCFLTDGDDTLQGQCSLGGCLAIARTKKADAIAAALQGKAPTFYKYYVPGGGPPAQSVDAYFTEPGIGGHFTPILISTTGNPNAVYDPALGKFLIVYVNGDQTQEFMRTGTDLFHWSDPTVVETTIAPAAVVSNTIVGTGSNPNLPGSNFYLYYVSFPTSLYDWPNGYFVRRQITITPSSLSSAVVATLDSAKVFPNPFVPSRGHSFITFGNLPSNARVQIYTVLGEKINEVVTDDTGSVEWDARNANGKEAASGVYYARLEGQGQKRTLKFAIQR